MKKYDLFKPEWTMWHILRCIREKMVTSARDYEALAYEKLTLKAPLFYEKEEQGILYKNSILDGDYTYKLTLPAQNLNTAHLICRTGGGEGEVLVNGRIKGSIDYMHNLVFLGDLKETDQIEIFLTKNYQQSSENYRQADIEREQIIYHEIGLGKGHAHTKRLFYLGQLLFEAARSYERPDFYEVLKKHLYEIDETVENEKFDEMAEGIVEALIVECQQLPPIENRRNWLSCAHSHLDLMFHWAEKDTIRKIGRTLSNAVSFLKRYPGNLYAQSQMQIFDWCSRFYPELFEEIKVLAGNGEIFPLGGLWCEADTYLPFTECWIRQCLYGKNYEKKVFGTEGRTAYMPDTFGFNPTLPQILRDFGYDYFVTTKLAWNDTTPFGHNEFIWKGIDGTCINGYQFPGFYSGPLDCDTLEYAKAHIAPDSTVKEHLFQYGAGDGGGGVNEEMLLTKELFGKLGVMDTFEDMKPDNALERIFLESGKEAPVVEGELYLQKHRGTYTNHAGIKRGNREMETLLRNAEAVNALLALGEEEKLQKLFKNLLVCQFHDTMAGTIVDSALEDVMNYYENIKNGTGEILKKGCSREKRPVIFNNSDRTGDILTAVRIADVSEEMRNYPMQFIRMESDGTGWYLLHLKNMQPFEMRELPLSVLEVSDDTNIYSEGIPVPEEVDFKHKIEAFFDRGGYFDGWDINRDYERYPIQGEEVLRCGILENGDLRTVYVREAAYPWGTMKQYMSMYPFTSRIDFHNEMEITKMHVIVKAAFDIEREEKTALFDMGYGFVKRNVSAEAVEAEGTFEMAHQKWMKAGNTAILNNGKYGCDVRENKMRLTLVKTSDFPGEAMDMGRHTMTYSLLEKEGFSVKAVVDEAEALNNPYCVLYTDKPAESLLLHCEGIKAGWIKASEDGTGTILRLYECMGVSGKAVVTLGKQVQKVYLTNMKEEILTELPVKEGNVEFSVKAFGIYSILLQK